MHQFNTAQTSLKNFTLETSKQSTKEHQPAEQKGAGDDELWQQQEENQQQQHQQQPTRPHELEKEDRTKCPLDVVVIVSSG
mmetsp:Transcript_39931/g.77646  ORF Transcript_39931/g.77646 Transcript_39931/m.77646 type:complete len:81 (+) Transcript_39931:97-339(+)